MLAIVGSRAIADLLMDGSHSLGRQLQVFFAPFEDSAAIKMHVRHVRAIGADVVTTLPPLLFELSVPPVRRCASAALAQSRAA